MYNKYFFLHMLKTGGTSLFNVFNDVLGEENVKQVVSINKGPKQLEALNKYKFIGGHFTYSDYLDYIDQDRYTITFLRNPVDRFISQYFFFKNNYEDLNKEPTVANTKKFNLEEYIEYYRKIERYGVVFNRQLWYFVGPQKYKLSEAEAMEIAKENLSKMNFVGIVEELADSVDLLCYDCNWPLVENMPLLNVTSNKPTNDEIDKKTLEVIKELNDLDFQLYDYAIKIFNDKKRQILQDAVKRNHENFHSVSGEILSSEECLKKNEVKDLEKNQQVISSESKKLSSKNCGSGEIKIDSVRLYNNNDGNPKIEVGGEFFIEITFQSYISAKNVVVGFVIEDEFGQKIYGTNSLLMNQSISVEKDENYCVVYSLNMNIAEGMYVVNVTLHSDKCYSLATKLENNFQKFLDLHLDECYNCYENNKFAVMGNKGNIFDGIAKLEPNITLSKTIDKLDKETVEKIFLKIKEIPLEVETESEFFCIVDIMNFAFKVISSSGENPIHISYHWFDEKGDTIVHFEGLRSHIRPFLFPFNHNEYKLKVISPQKKGKYRLRVTLVQEGYSWLDELNQCLCEERIIEIK